MSSSHFVSLSARLVSSQIEAHSFLFGGAWIEWKTVDQYHSSYRFQEGAGGGGDDESWWGGGGGRGREGGWRVGSLIELDDAS